MEYSLIDLYEPFLLRRIDLMGSRTAAPLYFDTSPNSFFVYVKTVDQVEGIDYYGVSVIRLSTSAVDSYYAFFEMPNGNFDMASIELNDSSTVEILSSEGAYSKKIYFEPLLTIYANIESDVTQKQLSMSLKVVSPTQNLKNPFVLKLVNFQLPVNALPINTHEFTMIGSINTTTQF
jgi:hypothetical protein